MAIIKEKELGSGAVGNYWVAQPTINMIEKNTEIIMLLFKDKEARLSGKTFLCRERVPNISGVYLTGEQIYSAVKKSRMSEATEEEAVEQNWFSDAEDDI